MTMVNPVSYRFGEYCLDPQARELRLGDERLVLPASAFDCLVYLVEHRERAVGRDELIAAVWGRVDVSEKLLGQTIVRIRRAFGDTGNEQHSVRTVARFGYRWVALTQVDDAGDPLSRPFANAFEAQPRHADPGDGAPAATPAAHVDHAVRWTRVAMAALVLVALAVSGALWLGQRDPIVPAAESIADAPDEQPGAPTLVLPANIAAPEEWSWLRLGLMDMVATRLRRAHLPTASSESVVALLKQQPHTDGPLLDDPDLAPAGTLRVQPTVTLRDNEWTVVLETAGARTVQKAQAQSDDVLTAARRATDALLIRLGHQPPPASLEGESDAFEELLYRVNAALFADQLELAGRLIGEASPAMQQSSQIAIAQASLEMRSGQYRQASERLQRFIASPAADADRQTTARAYNTLAAIYVRENRADDAEQAYSKAIGLLADRSEPGELGYAYMGRGIVAVMRAQQDQGVADLGLARIEMEAVGDAYGAAKVDLNLALTDMTRHRVAEALSTLDMASERLQALGAREDLAYARIRGIDLRIRLLRYDEAMALSDALWPPEAHSGNQRLQWRIVLSRTRALASVGRIGEARALIQRIATESDPEQDGVVRAESGALAAELSLQLGDATAALAQASAAMTPELRSFDSYVYGRIALVHARALLALGRLDEAGEAVDSLAEWARSQNDQWRPIYATLARAELAWSRNERTVALEQFDATTQLAQRANGPEDLVTVVVPYIRALIDDGHLERAGAVSGRIMPWAERDYRVAWTQARLYRAMNMTSAARQAVDRARQLAGERSPSEFETGMTPAGDR